LLSAAGASVEVWARDTCSEMEALAADPPGGTVTIMQTTWSGACLGGAAVVVAAAPDEAEAL
jgi:hypothetical protein